MTASFPRVLPRHALGCYLGAAALLYLFSAQLLAIIDIWLLPRGLLVEMLRYRAMWLVFFLTLPTVGYLLWRGSDLVAWWRAPAALTLDDRALHLGARTVAFSDIASLRHRHNRDHLLLTLANGERVRLRLAIWEGADELLELLDARVGGDLEADARRRIDAGATVAFGALGMNAAGLVHKGQQIPWTAIDTIRTQSDSEGMETDETLIIVAQGKTHKIDRSRIDNEPVMLACLQRYLPAA
ncbi:MAG: hypothetical protein J0I68_10890 [Achromobacter sp.]|jgi:hypothetical protein|uniref:Uncharacterized protein n=1 Tax=Achromobacter insuavis TaxID=1287735 RepID=A0A6J5HC87_9BURK|nr:MULTISPECIES: hypothetical protein [Achromobacter]MBN9639035.1 hypothetical protein [Achromobacter sp.]CAB3632840.1 hypothetical protein LMG26845_01030 [Achromobacter insuavis]CAB3829523.1 hypothetical protein LMG26846_00890 [Achromobacter insuavis]CUI30355.1 Uncharacterised protein [Achromobacter sp. 2789STDY5608628]CUI55483.1 Uncharacterised protein [Achromobacter sp. 2789STDY5608633]